MAAQKKNELSEENITALEKGMPNLLRHVANIKNVYGLPCVVAVNRFPTDTEAELSVVIDECRKLGVNVVLSEVWAKGGEGGEALAREVVRLCDEKSRFDFAYSLDRTIKEKIDQIVKRVYGGDGISISPNAEKQIKKLETLGFGSLPVCIAKHSTAFPMTRKSLVRRSILRLR